MYNLTGVGTLLAIIGYVAFIDPGVADAQIEGAEIVALVPSDRQVSAGAQVEFTVPADKLHLFDPETEKTLTN